MNTKIFQGVALAALCGMAWIPAGCNGQESRQEVEVRVDATPIERQAVAVVNSYAEVLNEVRPAVVSVYSQRVIREPLLSEHPVLERFFGSRDHREGGAGQVQSGLGSGVVISAQGYILTNNHVIDGADEISVQLEDGREFEAELIGADPRTDVAVLRVSGEDLPSAVLADSDIVAVGDVVFALGNALGIGHAVTTGIISARGRTGIGILGEEGYEDFLQTDASMNVGNSGGPLVDSRGRVIGINTAIASPGGGNVGIGFAIPINMAREVMQSLIQHGEVLRGYLGITLQDLNGELADEFGASDGGVLVVNVLNESPAAGAGLKQGDVVVGINGEQVGSAGVLRLRVGQMAPDSEVRVTVLRNGERVEVPIVLGRQEQQPKKQDDRQSSLSRDELLEGVGVSALTPQLRKQLRIAEGIEGLVVTETDVLSPFAETFPVGSLILQVNREHVEDVDTARDLIREGRNLFLLLIDGAFQYVTVQVQTS
jgi:serine protease Do